MKMQQIELQKEFNELIQQISKDVLELSVLKSVEKASNEIKKQVPGIEKNSAGLKKSIDVLQGVSKELSAHLQETKIKENKIDDQLKNIRQKADGNTNILNTLKNDTAKQYVSQKRKLDAIDEMISTLDKDIQEQFEELLDSHRQDLKSSVVEINEEGNSIKKVAAWNLFFTIAIFGATVTILLNVFSII